MKNFSTLLIFMFSATIAFAQTDNATNKASLIVKERLSPTDKINNHKTKKHETLSGVGSEKNTCKLSMVNREETSEEKLANEVFSKEAQDLKEAIINAESEEVRLSLKKELITLKNRHRSNKK